jgi:hypothetical protein
MSDDAEVTLRHRLAAIPFALLRLRDSPYGHEKRAELRAAHCCFYHAPVSAPPLSRRYRRTPR